MNNIDTVLLVDDDNISIFLNLHAITNWKVKNLEVRNNGKEALEYLRNCGSVGKPWPNLILLDLEMPEMDGAEFLKEFYELDTSKKEETKIVIVTVVKDGSNRMALCKAYGIDSYVEKPLSEKKMKEVLGYSPLVGTDAN